MILCCGGESFGGGCISKQRFTLCVFRAEIIFGGGGVVSTGKKCRVSRLHCCFFHTERHSLLCTGQTVLSQRQLLLGGNQVVVGRQRSDWGGEWLSILMTVQMKNYLLNANGICSVMYETLLSKATKWIQTLVIKEMEVLGFFCSRLDWCFGETDSI